MALLEALVKPSCLLAVATYLNSIISALHGDSVWTPVATMSQGRKYN